MRRVVINQMRPALLGLAVAGGTLFAEVWILHGRSKVVPSLEHFHTSIWIAALPLLPMVLLLVKPAVDRLLRKCGNGIKINLPRYTSIGIIICSIIAIGVTGFSLSKAVVTFAKAVGKMGSSRLSCLSRQQLVFVDAMEVTGFIERVVHMLKRWKSMVRLLSMCSAMVCAALTGTSDAPVTALNTAFLGEARALGFDPVDFGSLTWIGGEMGRCLSVVAMVTATVAGFVHCESSWAIVNCCVLPMLFAAIMVYVAIRYQAHFRGNLRK